jgi:hypothetical protein
MGSYAKLNSYGQLDGYMGRFMDPVLAAGLFSIVGVVVGSVLNPLNQLYLDGKQRRRAAKLAKKLIAGELLQAQNFYGATVRGAAWPVFEDINALLPTAAWQEHKANLVDHVDDDVWNNLLLMYLMIEMDRQRFISANKMATPPPLQAKQAVELAQAFKELGTLRKALGAGGGFPNDIQKELEATLAKIQDQSNAQIGQGNP